MLLHSDSFDLYNTPLQGYDIVVGSPAITTANPRTGIHSLVCPNSLNAQSVQKNIPLSQTIICGVGMDVVPVSTTNFTIFTFLDGITAQVTILCDGSGHLRALRGSAGGTLLGTSTNAITFGSFHYVEAKVKVDPSAGTVDIQIDGSSFLSLSGINTSNTGTSQVGAVVLGLTGAANQVTYFDDYYINDNTGSFNNGFEGPSAILALLSIGNGTLNQWSIGGSAPAATNWQSVNENPPDDGVTFVFDGTVGDIDRYIFPTIASAYPSIAVGAISAVNVKMRAEMDTPGSRAIRAAVKSSATLGTSPSDLLLTTGWADYQGILETDPNTSAPWTVAGVNAAEFGQKVTA